MSKLGRIFSFTLKRLDKGSRRQFILTAVFALFLNLLAVFIPFIQKNLIDSISLRRLDFGLLAVFLLAGLSVSIIAVLEALSLNNIVMSTKQQITFELLESVMRKDNKLLNSRGPGAYMVSIFGNSEQMALLLKKNYFSIFAVCIASLATLIISLKWTWTFAAIILVSYLLLFIIIAISNKSYAKSFAIAREFVYELNPKVLEYIENRRSIAANVSNKLFLFKLKEIILKRDKHFKSALAANAIASSAVGSVKNMAITVFFVASMIQILNKQMPLSAFIALLSYFHLVFIPVNALHELSAGLKKFDILFDRIKDDIDLKPEVALPENETIKLSKCTFGYGSDSSVIELDLEIKGRMGLVGLSGEGKTTVIRLLTGRLAPDNGLVQYGTTNVSNIPQAVIGLSTRLYNQEPEIFNETLKFNITLRRKELSEQEYARTLVKLQLDIEESLNWLLNSRLIGRRGLASKKNIELLSGLYGINEKYFSNPKIVYDMQDNLKKLDIKKISQNLAPKYCSRMYYVKERYESIISDLKLHYLSRRLLGQRGAEISGGEKTKIALARFLLPISNEPYIIDEPFVNLDLLSEQENLEVLNRFTKAKNGLLISHKMNVVKALSDEIIVLENGRITQRGTHKQLIQTKGLYYRLYQKYLENMKNSDS